MAIDNSDIEASKLAVQKAIEAHGAAYARLFASDNRTPISGPDLHARQVAAIVAPLEREVERAAALADRVVSEVEAARLAPYADPTSALSAADLADANLRSRWVAEDCSELPLSDLAERLRAVHASGNRASIWLHSRYAKRRWQKESAKQSQDAALSAFAATCRELGVIGDRAGLSSEAVKRQESAAALSRWAQGQLRIARDPAKDAADRAKSAEAIRRMF